MYLIDLWYFILLILLFLQKLLDNVNNNLDKARSDQQVLRNFEARDRNTQENNFQRVNFLSGVQVFIMLSVALTQVLLIRSLFDDRKKVQMRASTWWKVPVRLYGFRKLFHVVWSCLIVWLIQINSEEDVLFFYCYNNLKVTLPAITLPLVRYELLKWILNKIFLGHFYLYFFFCLKFSIL